jgi:hypothetical protein
MTNVVEVLPAQFDVLSLAVIERLPNGEERSLPSGLAATRERGGSLGDRSPNRIPRRRGGARERDLQVDGMRDTDLAHGPIHASVG